MPDLENSILKNVRKMIGLQDSDTAFDTDLIVNINSVFMILNQLGIGPTPPFFITDDSKTWTDFSSDINLYNSVKTYMHMKIKLVFDPPPNSFAMESYARQILELEYRLVTQYDITNYVSG